MRRTSAVAVIFGAVVFAAAFPTIRAQQRSANDGVFAAEQVKRGEAVYTESCAACHDPMLIGGVGPALAGKDFFATWKDKSVAELFTKIKNEMPLTAPGTLTAEQTSDNVAYILSFNKFPAGAAPLATDPAVLKDIKVGEPGTATAGGGAPATSGATATGGAAPVASGAPAASGSGLFADAQAKRGEALYAEQCAACHDPKLIGGVGPALAGPDFLGVWKTKSLGEAFDKIKNEMPLTAPGTLTSEQTADILAFMLSVNNYPAGGELKPDAAALKAVPFGEPAR